MLFHRQVYEFLKSSGQIVRYLLTFLVITILAACWYLLFYSPLSAAVIFYTSQKVLLSTKKAKFDRINRTIGKLPSEVEQREQEFSKKWELLEINEHLILEKFFACFKKQTVVLTNCVLRKKEELADLSTVAYESSFEGSFDKIVDCLRMIENLFPSVICKRCELRKTEKGCEGTLPFCLIYKKQHTQGTLHKEKTKSEHASKNAHLSNISTNNNVCALRDPFSPLPRQSIYAYIAFGTIHRTTQHCGLLMIDGITYSVKEKQLIADHMILSLSEDDIVIKNRQGKEIKIRKQEKALQLR